MGVNVMFSYKNEVVSHIDTKSLIAFLRLYDMFVDDVFLSILMHWLSQHWIQKMHT